MADSERTQTTKERDPASHEERRSFEAEVSRLLELMVHSVYSDREIFLRELISNASDACDKLRYEAITDPELTRDDPEFRIRVEVDPEAGTITVSDNGVGMDREALVSDLGTIARSGTQAFADRLTGDKGEDLSLIGQFGVGFYASFMVAETVRVRSRRAGTDNAHEWESDGRGDYVIRPAERATRGTDVTLILKEDAREFLDKNRLEAIVRKYSDHIAVPIILADKSESSETAEEKPVNDASALWTRPKSEISQEQYTEFYRHVSHALDTPALTVHNKAEGVIAYTSLLFVPSQQPMDLFDPARKPRVKLYVKRVFITEDTEALLPGYLRFLRGIIDSEDLPLNISREMLQTNPVIRRLNKAITNKVLGELGSLAEKDKEAFESIWSNFGAVLKEGIYEDSERREQLLELARFKSTQAGGWTSLADYLSRMKEGQKAIYYVTGNDADAVTRSPQLEGFRARGVEVLLLSDPVDDFWLSATQEFEGKPFKSITRGASDLKDLGEEAPESGADEDRPKEGEIATLVTVLKEVLGEAVADVRSSDRLTETPACLVADEHGLDMHLERILRQHQQLGADMAKVLEINPGHPLIAAMSARAQEDGAVEALTEPAELLLDQARVLEGEPPSDPAAFAKRLSSALESSLRE